MLAQGAEAIIEKIDDAVVKKRISKSYRVKEIDTLLRKSRTRREAKVLTKLQEYSLPAPRIIAMDDSAMTITMSFIDGKKLRDVLADDVEKWSEELGILLAKLHSHDIIHGDLTTSNMVVTDGIHLIDFGLSFFSSKVEDKAVDLHVLRQALESTHHDVFEKSYDIILTAYTKQYEDAKDVLTRLQQVEARGRNKAKY
jgi:Kae1-associated kinase Bud32